MHEHEWLPYGFTVHPQCGGLVPTDYCACGAFHYPNHEDRPGVIPERVLPAEPDAATQVVCSRSDCEKDRVETGECHCSVYGDPVPSAGAAGGSDV